MSTVTNNHWCKDYKLGQLSLTGIFLALIILTKLLSIFLGPFILGYSLQLQYLPYIMALIIIKNRKYKLILFFITPLLLITLVNQGTNPLFDYILTMYSFGGMMLIPNLTKNSHHPKILLVIVFALCLMVANWWNIISGVVYYKVTWQYSVVFNSIFNVVNFVIITPLLIINYHLIDRAIKTYELTY